MTPYEAYVLYNGLRLHFTNPLFDYFRYHGVIRSSFAGFKKRKDQYFYEKLAKHDDVKNFIVANLVYGDHAKWIGNLVKDEEAERIYKDWLTRRHALSYYFVEDLNNLEYTRFIDNFIIEKHHMHPPVMRLFLQGKFSYESLIILDNTYGIFNYFNLKIEDIIVWPAIYQKAIKYAPFLTYDKDRLAAVLRKWKEQRVTID